MNCTMSTRNSVVGSTVEPKDRLVRSSSLTPFAANVHLLFRRVDFVCPLFHRKHMMSGPMKLVCFSALCFGLLLSGVRAAVGTRKLYQIDS